MMKGKAIGDGRHNACSQPISGLDRCALGQMSDGVERLPGALAQSGREAESVSG